MSRNINTTNIIDEFVYLILEAIIIVTHNLTLVNTFYTCMFKMIINGQDVKYNSEKLSSMTTKL